jgi:transcription antitermination factor NusG
MFELSPPFVQDRWAEEFEGSRGKMSTIAAFRQPGEHPWYAVRTRSRFEPIILQSLAGKGYTSYLPTLRRRRKWSDRTVELETPLFPGYVFSRFDVKRRLPILQTPGVLSIVSFGKEPEPVDESEIEAVRTILSTGMPADLSRFICEGQKVRVVRGPLMGLEGILEKKKKDCRLLVSVTLLQRSIAAEIDGDWIEPIR